MCILNETVSRHTDAETGHIDWHLVYKEYCSHLPYDNTEMMMKHYMDKKLLPVIEYNMGCFFFDIIRMDNYIVKRHSYRGIPNRFYTREECLCKAFSICEAMLNGEIDKYYVSIKPDESLDTSDAYMQGHLEATLSITIKDLRKLLDNMYEGGKYPYKYNPQEMVSKAVDFAIRMSEARH